MRVQRANRQTHHIKIALASFRLTLFVGVACANVNGVISTIGQIHLDNVIILAMLGSATQIGCE
jgi:hypothetical protein